MNTKRIVLTGCALFALLSTAWGGDTGSAPPADSVLAKDSAEFAPPKRKDTQQSKASFQAKLERLRTVCTPDHFPTFASLDSSDELTKGEKKKCRDRLKFLNPTME